MRPWRASARGSGRTCSSASPCSPRSWRRRSSPSTPAGTEPRSSALSRGVTVRLPTWGDDNRLHAPARTVDAGCVKTLAPGLLLAMPQLGDPNFHRSVVLMLEHGEGGSMGLVINRGAPLTLGELA